jgi:hypothetical protein
MKYASGPAPGRDRARFGKIAGGLAVVGVVLANLTGLDVAGAAVSAPARTAVGDASSKVVCRKQPPIKTPPRGVLKLARARAGGQASRPTATQLPQVKPKPLCPRGEVPVTRPVKGAPDLGPRSAAGGPFALPAAGHRPQPPAGPQCDGTFEYGICYYWAGAVDTRTDEGGGYTMTIEKPTVTGAGHSIEETYVSGGPGNNDAVEIGTGVFAGNPDPELYVYHWINGNTTCYNGCGWQQISNTYYPGEYLPGMVGKSVYNGYVYYQGYWYAWFNDQWLGRFPGSLWSGQFQNSQVVYWFGEVATSNGVPPLTQMGNGLFASNTHAAPMSTLCDVNVKAWLCYYYDQQSLYQTDPNFYTVAHTGFGAMRLGGPGK